MKRALLEQVLDDRRARRPVIVATVLANGEQRLVHEDDAADGKLAEAVRQAFANDRSGVVETGEGEVFLHVHNPPLRMVIIGAVHVAQYLVPMATMAGYAVSVVDPRAAFATRERFPDVDLNAEWPDEAWRRLGVDRRTAVVALTHDPKIDDPALTAALGSQAFYIGALGSRKTHASRIERLRANGIDEGQLARIHAPVGLDIGAQGAAEIAIAILAEVTANLRQRGGTDRTGARVLAAVAS